MTSAKVVVLAITALLAAGCSGSAAVTAKAPAVTTKAPAVTTKAPAKPPRLPAGACKTSGAKGACGPYNKYARITRTTSSTYVGNDVWNPIPGWRQTLHAADPGDWYVTARMPAGNTAVVSYPSVGANYGQTTDVPTPLTDYASIYSSFSENMNATARTSAWAAYDIWLGQDNCAPNPAKCAGEEVMIQHDFANNGPCPAVANATFGGSGGVPVQKWHLCKFGSELIWKLIGNEQSGRVNVLAMLTWLVGRHFLPARTGLWAVEYGWEICSTGGVNENFQIKSYSIMPIPARNADPH
jgi:hypothetical protein